MKDTYLYCYSTNLQIFLKNKGFKYICSAYHSKTMRKFWQFKRNQLLEDALDEYRKVNLVVEFDGKQHRTPVPNFDGLERFLKDKQNDIVKEKLVTEKKYIFLRVSSKENWTNIKYLESRLHNVGIGIK